MDIMESNLLVVSDPVLSESVISRIKQLFKAETAIIQVFDKQIDVFKSVEDEYLKTRSEDLEHIKKRLLFILKHKLTDFDVSGDTVVVAQSLFPSDIINFNNSGIQGLITEQGGITSHVSIMTRSYQIPSVIGIADVLSKIPQGSDIIINGFLGTVYVNPTQEMIEEYKLKQQKLEERKKELGKLKDINCTTTDGKSIKVYTNIDMRQDMVFSEVNGSDGVGLMRTESLIIKKGRFPTYAEQLAFYKEMCEIAYPKPVTIRAFDVGSDKFSEAIPNEEANPALGLRGIRYLLHRRDIFRSQIKAVLAASVNKNVKFMLPMVTNVTELIETRKIIKECMAELKEKRVPFDKTMPVGIMIETPAAALTATAFAPHCDFFSIGTNDLTQYTLGVDRTNEMVSHLFNPYHPAVFNLIRMVVESVKNVKMPITICGEIASYTEAIPILIGLGITELSVTPALVLETKNVIINTSKKDAENTLTDFLNTYTPVLN
jgi:phosphotransferase system enzyme I (PtsI)